MRGMLLKRIFVLASSIALALSATPASAGPAASAARSISSSVGEPRSATVTVSDDDYEFWYDDEPLSQYAASIADDLPPPGFNYAQPIYEWAPAPPTSCGEYRYWNGERCADARYEPPYLGPKW